jgi:hypothetical protein
MFTLCFALFDDLEFVEVEAIGRVWTILPLFLGSFVDFFLMFGNN